jgi:hypothetical protein
MEGGMGQTKQTEDTALVLGMMTKHHFALLHITWEAKFDHIHVPV